MKITALDIAYWAAFAIAVIAPTSLRAAPDDNPNLITNGDFEQSDTNWTYFVPTGSTDRGCTFLIASDQPHSGGLCAKMHSDETARFAIGPRATLPVQPGQRYDVEIWFRGGGTTEFLHDSPGVVLRVSFAQKTTSMPDQMLFISSQGTVVRGDQTWQSSGSKFAAGAPSDWTRLAATIEVPPGADVMNFTFFTWYAKGDVFVDDLSVKPAPSGSSLTTIFTPPPAIADPTVPATNAAPATTPSKP